MQVVDTLYTTTVNASAYPLGINLDADHLDWETAYATIESVYVFRPEYSSINLDITSNIQVSFGGSGGWGDLSLEIYDLTGAATLFSFHNYFNPPYPSSIDDDNPASNFLKDSIALSFIKDSSYELRIFGSIVSSDSVDEASLAGAFKAPEPETIWLLIAGLTLLAVLFRGGRHQIENSDS